MRILAGSVTSLLVSADNFFKAIQQMALGAGFSQCTRCTDKFVSIYVLHQTNPSEATLHSEYHPVLYTVKILKFSNVYTRKRIQWNNDILLDNYHLCKWKDQCCTRRTSGSQWSSWRTSRHLAACNTDCLGTRHTSWCRCLRKCQTSNPSCESATAASNDWDTVLTLLARNLIKFFYLFALISICLFAHD